MGKRNGGMWTRALDCLNGLCHGCGYCGTFLVLKSSNSPPMSEYYRKIISPRSPARGMVQQREY
jgi:hypothetical protein